MCQGNNLIHICGRVNFILKFDRLGLGFLTISDIDFSQAHFAHQANHHILDGCEFHYMLMLGIILQDYTNVPISDFEHYCLDCEVAGYDVHCHRRSPSVRLTYAPRCRDARKGTGCGAMGIDARVADLRERVQLHQNLSNRVDLKLKNFWNS